MIQITPCALPQHALDGLADLQFVVDAEIDYAKRVTLARRTFAARNRPRNAVFIAVRSALNGMCAGVRRCMYCEDSRADEIEHYRPKALYPELVFRWENYLYSCGPCNSAKKSRFAVRDGAGQIVENERLPKQPIAPPVNGDALLIDPRNEDPLNFMRLDIAGDTFRFVPTAPAGSLAYERTSYTIRVLKLNENDLLSDARREAYGSYLARLKEYIVDRDAGLPSANRKRDAIIRMGHPTVWREMRRQRAAIQELHALFEIAPEALGW